MSEQTMPANAGDETVAAADAPLSEAETKITNPLAADSSQDDETSETGSSDEVDEGSEATASSPGVDAGGPRGGAANSETALPEDQAAIVDHAGIPENATGFIAEAWAPDDAAPPESDDAASDGEEAVPETLEAAEPSSGDDAGLSADARAGAADPADALDEEPTAELDAEIPKRAAEFIAEAWAPDDAAPPAVDEPAPDGAPAISNAYDAELDDSSTTAPVSEAVLPETQEVIVDDAEVSASAADFIAEAWAPDAGDVGPSAESEEISAGPLASESEGLAGDETAAVSESEDPAFDGGELVAESQEPETAGSGEATPGGGDSAAWQEPAAGESPAGDGAMAVAETDQAAAATADEPATTEQAGPVLAADAIAATAIASNEQAEKDREADAAPVVVDRELAWGFVDTEGRIHQQTTEHFRGRWIGKAVGSGDLQIAEFESNFGPLAKEVELLEAEVVTAKNKVAIMGRVRKMKSTAGRSEALGDFEDLFVRLHALEGTIQTEIDERRTLKEAIIVRAEEIKESTEWKVTGDAYKELFQEWKLIGATGREADDVLWARFIGAREHFNNRRGEHFNQRQEQWEENRLLKQDVIVRAHELSTSDQWRPTSDALRALFDEWKKVGSAGRQSDEELWQQFRGAQQHFYDRRNAAYDENRLRKEQLCQRAEDLRESTDWNATVEEMKAMMADWKTAGTSGKRDVDDALWNRFRGAQNAFFDKRYADASAREQEERSQSHRKEEIAAAIESLAYSGDAVAAGEQAVALRGEFEALPSIRRDREEQLERRIRKAMGDIRVNAAAEGARRSVSWQGKLRQALERSQDQIESLNQTVANQETALVELRANLETAGEDDKADIEQQIQELYESLSYNQAEIERLKGSMSDISDNVQV